MRLATTAATSKALPKAETRNSFTGSFQTWLAGGRYIGDGRPPTFNRESL